VHDSRSAAPGPAGGDAEGDPLLTENLRKGLSVAEAVLQREDDAVPGKTPRHERGHFPGLAALHEDHRKRTLGKLSRVVAQGKAHPALLPPGIHVDEPPPPADIEMLSPPLEGLNPHPRSGQRGGETPAQGAAADDGHRSEGLGLLPAEHTFGNGLSPPITILIRVHGRAPRYR
jgi:hypothetical protein